MRNWTYTFEFEDPDRAEVFLKDACNNFGPEVYAQRMTYSDKSKLPPRILVTGTNSYLYDQFMLKKLTQKAKEYGGHLVAINGRPAHENGTFWEE